MKENQFGVEVSSRMSDQDAVIHMLCLAKSCHELSKFLVAHNKCNIGRPQNVKLVMGNKEF